MAPQQPNFAEQLRTNLVFEHFIFSVLIGAVCAGAINLLINLGSSLASGFFSPGEFLSAFLGAMIYVISVFLIGFASGVIVIIPLVNVLEKKKRRNIWPFLAVALAIALAVLTLISNLPGRGVPEWVTIFTVVASAIIVALVFIQRLRPIWKAAAMADAEESDGAVIHHIH